MVMTDRSERATLVFTLTALIFYIPANLFPFMTIEFYGRRNSATIWSGVTSLFQQRAYTVAVIVFLASILIPILKLIILLYLSLTARNGRNLGFKKSLVNFVEAIGRWSMLDIFLLAILVALVKLGHLAAVNPEKGSFLFALVVVFTMMASYCFDSEILGVKK